jgi:hypothetical protein
MNIKILTGLAFLLSASSAMAINSPIQGNVQAKCSIWTETSGIYGNPLPNKLDTTPSSGGTKASIRVDIAQANFYKTRFTTPTSFSSSPTLSDNVTFTGSTVVGQVSVAAMSAYEGAKVISPANVTTFTHTLAGSTWFTVSSTAMYGYNKSFPAGQYTAIIQAECIAI